ncbi:MAG: excinuclease ABC subunit UvrA [Bacteroidales bacterium]|nr:excinuclease ABC subunit UvrA [Bacteroidales bacterium]
MAEYIEVKNARVNNLKNLSVNLPRDKFIVVTGLSGSGKSSLAFDTLYAEGKRRYVESLSAYTRQFLGRMPKPECDFIRGLPPAIAIEQKTTSRNPRSTVGTSTEIYDYLRLLFARVGRTYSPISGQEVKRHTIEDVVQQMLAWDEGTRFTVLAPLKVIEGRSLQQQLQMAQMQGFARIDVKGEMYDLAAYLEQPVAVWAKPEDMCLLIDRMAASDKKDTIARLVDSAETAFYEGDGLCLLREYPSRRTYSFSTRFEADGIVFQEPDDNMFAFNSPLGACPVCEGYGRTIGIDEALVIPDRSRSVYEGAVMCWRGEKMSQWRDEFCRRAEPKGFRIFEPYYNLTQDEIDLLWHGDATEEALPEHERVSIDAFFQMLDANAYKIQNRVMKARYQGKTTCHACRGSRLRKEATYVKVAGHHIAQLVQMSVDDLAHFFDTLTLDAHDARIAQRLLVEIRSRLRFLAEVGLGYLTLGRLSETLSGGEAQRINLATSLGSALVGSLYILDEPSIGLHSRDTERLIKVLHQLRDLGNTVLVVEHDEEIMRAADYIVDIGPDAGRLGGEVVYEGNMSQLKQETSSHTVRYLLGEDTLPIPATRRVWNRFVEVRGARQNNLKNISVRFPLNVLTVVTGVSGSGKSTLVNEVLYRNLCRYLDITTERPGESDGLGGDLSAIAAVDFVDQNPIGKSLRSNPATYIGAFDDIRKLYADQPLSKQMGYTPGFFSINTDVNGGRCPECKGMGTTTVEMQFMADLVLPCESCGGQRFKREALEVMFHEHTIYNILELTIDQAIEFFAQQGQTTIVRKLQPLQDVGLGYVKMGQSSSTLSGGENQRVKLAYYLSQERAKPTFFIFDEPTTGLHFHDIRKLMQAFDALIERGHTVLIIEHNMDVIKCADHIVDIGREGGAAGGYIVCEGTPEEVAICPKSYTGEFLRAKL